MRLIYCTALLLMGLGCGVQTAGLSTIGELATGRGGMIACVSRDAAAVGRSVLISGGNAVDAAVAVAFAQAVTFPEAGNIGGGGFMLIHFPDGRPPVFIDYRETAPMAVGARSFHGKADRTPEKLVGVPGTVRGLALARQLHGKKSWRELIAPAIALAKDGFVLNQDGADSLNRVLTAYRDGPNLRTTFAKSDGTPWRAGDVLVQPELARTLQRIADEGPDAFYTGAIAGQILAQIKPGGSLMTLADLAAYQPVVRQPVRFGFEGYDVISAPPPSSGGLALRSMMGELEKANRNTPNLKTTDRFGADYLHLMTEAMKRAFAQRALVMGDPGFTTIPDTLPVMPPIDGRATPADKLAPNIALRDQSESTTHFSVLDQSGMAVSNTYTLENSYGAKIVVAGAGFLLNDELGDFNPQPGATTRGGQIGTDANIATGGKRPLSSMTPTMVTRSGKVVLITGSPGGRTIINTVFCVLVNRLVFKRPPAACIAAARHHHQWLPDQILMEKPLHQEHAAVLQTLRDKGHTIDPTARRQGDAHSIFVDEQTGDMTGVADPRRSGSAAGY